MAKKGSREHLLPSGDHAVLKKCSIIPRKHKTKQRIRSSSLGSKVLKEALLQQKEIADEDDAKANSTNHPFSSITDDDPNCLYYDTEDDDFDNLYGQEFLQTSGGHDSEDVKEEEENLLDLFIGKHDGQQQERADVVLTKIREIDQHVSSEAQCPPRFDNSVIDIYKRVGDYLSNYTTKKLPKAFTFIPSLENWEDVLNLTEPKKWSPKAVLDATKIFASNLPRKQSRRFYSIVLLPRVRDDIEKNKVLHFYLCEALKKAIFKPDDFFEGILFPLCKSGTCTNREAIIIGGVITKISIPSSRVGPALWTLAAMDYSGTTSYFIKVLLDKKYCLQCSVVHGLVAHFVRRLDDTRVLPVIWHQSLLSFVQRYKNALTKEDKDKLLHLVEVQRHHKVTPEIKRELNNSCDCGEKQHPISTTYTASKITEDIFDVPDVPMEED